MSIYLPNIAVEYFDTMVHTEFLYGSGFRFRGCAQERKNVVGDIAHFRKKGFGIAVQRLNLQDDVIPMNIDYTDVPVTLQNWTASDYSDIFARAEVNFDETTELVQSVANAIALRYDQMTIDALSATTTTPVPDGGTGFTYAKFLAARKTLVSNGVIQRGSELYCVMSPTAEEQFLKEIEVNNSFYTTQRFIDNGGLDEQEYMKVKLIVLPDYSTGAGATGGLPITGDIRTCYMWAKPALGWAIGIDVKTEVNYIPQKVSWLINASFKGNCVNIDDNGIIPIEVDESV